MAEAGTHTVGRHTDQSRDDACVLFCCPLCWLAGLPPLNPRPPPGPADRFALAAAVDAQLDGVEKQTTALLRKLNPASADGSADESLPTDPVEQLTLLFDAHVDLLQSAVARTGPSPPFFRIGMPCL